MPLSRPTRFADAQRGVDLTIHGDPQPRISIHYQAAAQGLDLNVTVGLTENHGRFTSALSELGAVVDAPGAREHDEQRLRFANFARRAGLALPSAALSLRTIVNWLFTSREDTNYTYDLTPQNMTHLAHTLALVTGRPAMEMQGYIAEATADEALKRHITTTTDSLSIDLRAVADREPKFARRLGWYALGRALKPRLIVETGVDKGLGGILLCAALLRNGAEGQPGRYIGTDIRPTAGYLVSGPYAAVGKIAYGDSIASLAAIAEPIDMFINDSDHTLDYEGREYSTIAPRLDDKSIILSDNAHVTDALVTFAQETGRRFVFFREQPANHFHPGAGIGIAFK